MNKWICFNLEYGWSILINRYFINLIELFFIRVYISIFVVELSVGMYL